MNDFPVLLAYLLVPSYFLGGRKPVHAGSALSKDDLGNHRHQPIQHDGDLSACCRNMGCGTEHLWGRYRCLLWGCVTETPVRNADNVILRFARDVRSSSGLVVRCEALTVVASTQLD